MSQMSLRVCEGRQNVTVMAQYSKRPQSGKLSKSRGAAAATSSSEPQYLVMVGFLQLLDQDFSRTLASERATWSTAFQGPRLAALDCKHGPGVLQVIVSTVRVIAFYSDCSCDFEYPMVPVTIDLQGCITAQ